MPAPQSVGPGTPRLSLNLPTDAVHRSNPALQPRPSGPLRAPARRISLKGDKVGIGRMLPLREMDLDGLRRWLRLVC